ncbi:sigma-54 interaction domain-containing protein [Burkholderia gladioli]|uniref:sigma-54 interaction domain-containing protein n=1 Tax=Burkholderia gladioli TaxID=28095 RepID=UPI0016409A46|nr:sigma-54 dependent transcriptional regulator [Burkholderia gladioli]MDN7921683.1 sigma-54 dependent transcriptional regulator [Burkholderia gladioli]CAG9219225.1 Sigma-54-dependent Fis family transcriptional regulator [Burkholderia gladioli]
MSNTDRDVPRLAGESPAITALLGRIRVAARSQASVLVVGETGSGKDVVARLLHALGPRAAMPFVAVNCGAIPHDIAESQLFGHEKGSFTGAVTQHIGYFETARGGTLFLDEVADMPLELQVKLLRVLETGTILRVGGSEAIPVDVRIVAATHRDPAQAVRTGRFREDLFYRLAIVPLHVPPLRQRDSDAETLAQALVEQLNARHGTSKRLSAQALKVLHTHSWPGNVRELRNVVERGFILADQQIELHPATRVPAAASSVRANVMTLRIGSTLAQSQQNFIAEALRYFNGNKPRAAESLGISLKTLYNRLALMEPDKSGRR